MAAGETEPQMDPVISHFETFFAAGCLRFCIVDALQVFAFFRHFSSALKRINAGDVGSDD